MVAPKKKVWINTRIRRNGVRTIYGLAWYNDRWNRWSHAYPAPIDHVAPVKPWSPLDRAKAPC